MFFFSVIERDPLSFEKILPGTDETIAMNGMEPISSNTSSLFPTKSKLSKLGADNEDAIHVSKPSSMKPFGEEEEEEDEQLYEEGNFKGNEETGESGWQEAADGVQEWTAGSEEIRPDEDEYGERDGTEGAEGNGAEAAAIDVDKMVNVSKEEYLERVVKRARSVHERMRRSIFLLRQRRRLNRK